MGKSCGQRPKLKIRQLPEAFHLISAAGTCIAVVYFSDYPNHARAARRMSREEAKDIVVRIARFLNEEVVAIEGPGDHHRT